VFGQSLFGKGDYQFNNPQHHGTPAQRVDAMRAGYASGAQRDGLDAVAQKGVAHVLAL
jgi:hypothetical protein